MAILSRQGKRAMCTPGLSCLSLVSSCSLPKDTNTSRNKDTSGQKVPNQQYKRGQPTPIKTARYPTHALLHHTAPPSSCSLERVVVLVATHSPRLLSRSTVISFKEYVIQDAQSSYETQLSCFYEELGRRKRDGDTEARTTRVSRSRSTMSRLYLRRLASMG